MEERLLKYTVLAWSSEEKEWVTQSKVITDEQFRLAGAKEIPKINGSPLNLEALRPLFPAIRKVVFQNGHTYPTKDVLYVAKESGVLKYMVADPKGKTICDTISEAELAPFTRVSDAFKQKEFKFDQDILAELLTIVARRGQTTTKTAEVQKLFRRKIKDSSTIQKILYHDSLGNKVALKLEPVVERTHLRDFDDLRKFFGQLLAILVNLHEVGIVIRDTQNGNILYYSSIFEKLAQLADYEEAIEVDEKGCEKEPHSTVVIAVKPAPEQVRHGWYSISLVPNTEVNLKKADCWNVGVLLEDLLSLVSDMTPREREITEALISKLKVRNPAERMSLQDAMLDVFFGETSEERATTFQSLKDLDYELEVAGMPLEGYPALDDAINLVPNKIKAIYQKICELQRYEDLETGAGIVTIKREVQVLKQQIPQLIQEIQQDELLKAYQPILLKVLPEIVKFEERLETWVKQQQKEPKIKSAFDTLTSVKGLNAMDLVAGATMRYMKDHELQTTEETKQVQAVADFVTERTVPQGKHTRRYGFFCRHGQESIKRGARLYTQMRAYADVEKMFAPLRVFLCEGPGGFTKESLKFILCDEIEKAAAKVSPKL